MNDFKMFIYRSSSKLILNLNFAPRVHSGSQVFLKFPLVGVCLARGIVMTRNRELGNAVTTRNRGLGSRNMAVEVSNASKNLKFPFMTVCVCLARLRRKDQSHRQMALGAGEVFQNLDFWGAIWCLPPALKRGLVEVGADVVEIGCGSGKRMIEVASSVWAYLENVASYKLEILKTYK